MWKKVMKEEKTKKHWNILKSPQPFLENVD